MESGGEGFDVAVLMAREADLGLDMSGLRGEFIFIHGSMDTVVPIHLAEWLSSRVSGHEKGKRGAASARFIRVESATHNGVLMLLHAQVQEELARLAGDGLRRRGSGSAWVT